VRTLKKLVPAILLFLMGAAFGALGARAGIELLPELGFTGPQTALLVGALPVLYLVTIAIHEAGHVAGGLIAGFRTLLFIVGPFRLERTGERFRAGLNRSVLLAGGLAGMTPVGLHDLRRRTLVMIAGGPLVSLMAGAQLLAIYVALAPLLMRPGAGFILHFMAVVLVLVGVFSLVIGLATLVPAKSGGFYSDGARILRLLRATDETEREVALLALTGLTMAGTRPRDWDAGLVESSAGIRDGGPFEVTGRQFAYAHALDRGDIDAARAHLDAAVAGLTLLPGASRTPLLLNAATFYALYDGNAEHARRLLARAGAGTGLLSTPHKRVLAEAAVLLAEGDVTAARERAAQVRDLLAGAIDQGGAALDAALAGMILGGE
jgi:hypothetical protein